VGTNIEGDIPSAASRKIPIDADTSKKETDDKKTDIHGMMSTDVITATPSVEEDFTPKEMPPFDLAAASGKPSLGERAASIGGGLLTGAGLLASILGNAGAVNSNSPIAAQLGQGLTSLGGAIHGSAVDKRMNRELEAKTKYLASLPPSLRLPMERTMNTHEVSRRGQGSRNWIENFMKMMSSGSFGARNRPSDSRLKVQLLRSDLKLSDEEWKNILETDPEEMGRAILDEGPPFHTEEMRYLMKNLKNKFKYDDSYANLWEDKVLDDYCEHVHNYYYKYKPEAVNHDPSIDPEEQHIGPMAQDLEKVNPAVVKEDELGAKTVDTGRLALMNAGAIASLARQVKELKSE
jgi:hypothetical protein